MRVTRPSAAETIRPSPVGIVRCGSRKKYIMKSATAANAIVTGQNPINAKAAAISTGISTNGIPSRTIETVVSSQMSVVRKNRAVSKTMLNTNTDNRQVTTRNSPKKKPGVIERRAKRRIV